MPASSSVAASALVGWVASPSAAAVGTASASAGLEDGRGVAALPLPAAGAADEAAWPGIPDVLREGLGDGAAEEEGPLVFVLSLLATGGSVAALASSSTYGTESWGGSCLLQILQPLSGTIRILAR